MGRPSPTAQPSGGAGPQPGAAGGSTGQPPPSGPTADAQGSSQRAVSQVSSGSPADGPDQQGGCCAPLVYWRGGQVFRLARTCKLPPELMPSRLLDDDFATSVEHGDLAANRAPLCKHHGPSYAQCRHGLRCAATGCWKSGRTLEDLGVDLASVSTEERLLRYCSEHAAPRLRCQTGPSSSMTAGPTWTEDLEAVLATAPDSGSALNGYRARTGAVEPGLAFRVQELADSSLTTVMAMWERVAAQARTAELKCIAVQQISAGGGPAPHAAPTKQPVLGPGPPAGVEGQAYCRACSSWSPSPVTRTTCSSSFCSRCWARVPPVFHRCPSCAPHSDDVPGSPLLGERGQTAAQPGLGPGGPRQGPSDQSMGSGVGLANERPALPSQWTAGGTWPMSSATPPPPEGTAGYARVI